MTQPPTDADTFAPTRARNQLIRTIRDRLKGHHLDIRETTQHLVISRPGHPENGRIYITYATAEASHRRTTWEYLGRLDTHHNSDPDDESPITTDTIITILDGQPDTPPIAGPTLRHHR
jgi:hypothetical protein